MLILACLMSPCSHLMNSVKSHKHQLICKNIHPTITIISCMLFRWKDQSKSIQYATYYYNQFFKEKNVHLLILTEIHVFTAVMWCVFYCNSTQN